MMTCESCGRTVPRSKAVDLERKFRYSTDLKGEDNVSAYAVRVAYYCISCAKHRKIFEKKKQIAQRKSEHGMGGNYGRNY